MINKDNNIAIHRVATAQLPTKFGIYTVIGFQSDTDNAEHLALITGDFNKSGNLPLVRIHSECLTGDLLGSLRCDCGFQLHHALKQMADHGSGVLVYMRNHEGRGIGLLNKLKAYEHQDAGMDTVEANHHLGFDADLRDYGVAAEILFNIGVKECKLLTNNPAKVKGLRKYGIKVAENLPIIAGVLPENEEYLKTKHHKLSHMLPF